MQTVLKNKKFMFIIATVIIFFSFINHLFYYNTIEYTSFSSHLNEFLNFNKKDKISCLYSLTDKNNFIFNYGSNKFILNSYDFLIIKGKNKPNILQFNLNDGADNYINALVFKPSDELRQNIINGALMEAETNSNIEFISDEKMSIIYSQDLERTAATVYSSYIVDDNNKISVMVTSANQLIFSYEDFMVYIGTSVTLSDEIVCNLSEIFIKTFYDEIYDNF